MTLTVPESGVSFSVGVATTTGNDASLEKSLDDMIKDRRKEQQKTSKRAPKKTSNADRSIATGRAKREAASKNRRGLTPDKKPNAMDVEREVYRQSRKTADAKKSSDKKATGGRLAPDSSLRAKKRKKVSQDPPAAIFGGRTPSKQAVLAAVKGMEAAGFKVPNGHQVVMTFVPAIIVTETAPAKGRGKKAGGKPAGKQNGKPAGNQNGKPAGKQNKGDGRRKR